MRGTAVLGFALVTLTAFAGCVEESLDVVLRIENGRTLVLDDTRFYDGTILVQEGGTLVLDHADVRISQALVVEPGATVVSDGSTIVFGGGHTRQDIETSGTLSFSRTTVRDLRDFQVLSGSAHILDGSVETSHVAIDGGALSAFGTSWTVRYPEQDFGWETSDEAIGIQTGSLSLENASVEIVARTGIKAMGGDSTWRNVTLAANVDNVALEVHGGTHELRRVDARSNRAFQHVDGGTLRLIDTPMPAPQDAARGGGNGRLEVGWTLTVRAVTLPGNLPVGGLNVSLASAHDPTTTAYATTDENGDARFDAIEYVLDGTGSRSGNPHVAQADDSGKRGIATGLVVQRPATVTMPVVGALALPGLHGVP